MSTHQRDTPSADDLKVVGVNKERRTPGGAVVSVRLKADEYEVLSALAERAGKTVSETLRAALHAYISTPPSLPAFSCRTTTRGSWDDAERLELEPTR